MENKPSYTLGKNERLTSRKEIEQLFTVGKSFSLFPFKVIYQKHTAHEKPATNKDHLQAAFSIGKRHFKKAVDRNRIKRLMRETYRLQKMELQNQLRQSNGGLTVFILYVSSEVTDYEVLFSKMNLLLMRLQKIANEETVANT